MNYTKKSFTVSAPGTKTYADNWERTFRAEETKKALQDLGLKTTSIDEGSRWECGEPIPGVLVTSYAVLRWTGPLDDEIDSRNNLKHPVPPERWPYGPPDQHDPVCTLHHEGLYCDCEASAVDEEE